MNTSPALHKRHRSPSPPHTVPHTALPDLPPPSADAWWTAVKESFATAQWRRGCLRLDIPNNPIVPAAHLGSTPATRYITSNPWKLLRNMAEKESSSPVDGRAMTAAYGQAVHTTPPVPVSPLKWNAYWEAYSANCAEELETLATVLKAPSVDFRRVLLTLISTAVLAPLAPREEEGVLGNHLLTSGNLSQGGGGAVLSSFSTPGVLESDNVDKLHKGDVGSSPETAGNADNLSCSSSSLLSFTSTLQPAPAAAVAAAATHGGGTKENSEAPTAKAHGSAGSSSSYSYSSSYSSYTSSTYSSSRSSGQSSRSPSPARSGTTSMEFPALSTVLDDLVFAHAHHFGAVESIGTRHSNSGGSGNTVLTFVSVQFTTAEAAGLFYRWADGLRVEDLVESYWQQRQAVRPKRAETSPIEVGGAPLDAGSPWKQVPALTAEAEEEEEEAWWSTLVQRVAEGRLQLVAKLAPHDVRQATSTLLLGPHVLVSTPLVMSLFTGLFRATKVAYNRATGGFMISFADVDESRLALHALQCSLWTQFRLPLSYSC